MTDVSPMYARGMKSRIYWPRVIAVCSAVALGGGYVIWSQKKAEDRQRAKDDAEERELEKERERAMLPGSKSAWGTLPPRGWEPKRVENSERTNADFIQETPADGEAIAPPPPADEGKEPEKRRLLPGSKSIDAILSPSDVEEKP